MLLSDIETRRKKLTMDKRYSLGPKQPTNFYSVGSQAIKLGDFISNLKTPPQNDPVTKISLHITLPPTSLARKDFQVSWRIQTEI